MKLYKSGEDKNTQRTRTLHADRVALLDGLVTISEADRYTLNLSGSHPVDILRTASDEVMIRIKAGEERLDWLRELAVAVDAYLGNDHDRQTYADKLRPRYKGTDREVLEQYIRDCISYWKNK